MNVQKDHLCKISHNNSKPTSVYGILEPEDPSKVYFQDEINPEFKVKRKGLLGTANLGPNLNHSEFFITLTDEALPSLDGKHTIFGVIAEGLEILDKINEIYVDKKDRPLANIRIFHTLVLEDPLPNLEGLVEPEESPEPILNSKDRLDIDKDMKILFDNKDKEGELLVEIKNHKAITNAIVLETLDDLPDADIKPPENILFVCKLNPVTTERDLEIIFSVYGPIKKCDVVRDWKTGQSLQYAFIEYETRAACEEAYNKMDNALIDERRIHVDFCQSVAKKWHRHVYNQLGMAKQQGSSYHDPQIKKAFQDRSGNIYREGGNDNNKVKRRKISESEASVEEESQRRKERRSVKVKDRSRSRTKSRRDHKSRGNERADNKRRSSKIDRKNSKNKKHRSRSRSKSRDHKNRRKQTKRKQDNRRSRSRNRKRDHKKDSNKNKRSKNVRKYSTTSESASTSESLSESSSIGS